MASHWAKSPVVVAAVQPVARARRAAATAAAAERETDCMDTLDAGDVECG